MFPKGRALRTLLLAVFATSTATCATIDYTYLDDPSVGPLGVTELWGVNNHGDILGESFVNLGLAHTFIYSNGVFAYLTVPGFIGHGLNDQDQIAGDVYFEIGGVYSGAVVQNNLVQQTISFPGAIVTEAIGINNSGAVVGQYTSGNLHHAFLYFNGVYTDLGIPGDSFANGINNLGEIVGYYSVSGQPHGFTWVNGSYTTLDPPAFLDSGLAGINDQGVIVGDGCFYSNGVFTVVPPAGAWLAELASINNAGEMVGHAGYQGLIAEAVPEPGTFVEISLAALALVGFRLKRRLLPRRSPYSSAS